MTESGFHSLEAEPVFVIKNGLSALFLIAIWQARYPFKPFSYFFDDDVRHRDDVAAVLSLVDGAEKILAPRKDRPVIVYSTTSLTERHKEFLNASDVLEHVIVEHGTAEAWRYVNACLGKGRAADRYVFFFYREMKALLERRKLEACAPIEELPMEALRKLLGDRLRMPRGVERRSLFLNQPLVERGTVSIHVLEEIIHEHLARRPKMHYLIKDHPDPGLETIDVFARQCEKLGSTCEMVDSKGIVELSFPKYECSEVSTFYSTGAMTCAELYEVPYRTMLKEIQPHQEAFSPQQKKMVKFIKQLFSI